MTTECHGVIVALQNTEPGWPAVREPAAFK